jgi:hypothetical protein
MGSTRRLARALSAAGAIAFVPACQTTGLNPTGLHGGEARCAEGPRPMLDCRGAIQQYSRDFKADVAYMQKVGVGMGTISTKLIEADAITSDLVQHYYQTCSLYNACLISRQEYVAKTERLQDIQLSVRRALAAAGFGAQQNIQINPPGGPGGMVGPGGVPVGAAAPAPGMAAGETGQPGATPVAGVGPAPAVNPVDAILDILREGSRLVRQTPGPGATAAPAGPVARTAPPGSVGAGPPGAAGGSLEGALRGLLVALKQDVVRQEPAFGTARVAVGSFTEEGKPWSGPLGSVLQEQTARIVETGGVFSPSAGSAVRGLTVRPVTAVPNPNDPGALGALYGGDLGIVGSYRAEGDGVALRLRAVDTRGRDLAQQTRTIPRQAIPGEWAASPANAAETGQLLGTLGQLGPRSQGAARVDLTTNRPGTGASFRAGEEIRYAVTSTVDGYLYLFHVDADRTLLRIFPNQFQRDARIRPGAAVEIPGAGAPFRFEATPPFGLETTVAIVTPVPLDEAAFRAVEGGFAQPLRGVPELLASRGIRVAPADATAVPAAAREGNGATTPLVWNVVTVLIRP